MQKSPDDGLAGASRDRTRSSDSRSSTPYASRHQAAEQRRRTRINERLDLLRRVVPHAERANTACFLEEVIKYIDSLRKRNSELETALAVVQASGHASTSTPTASRTTPPLEGSSDADRQVPSLLETTLLQGALLQVVKQQQQHLQQQHLQQQQQQQQQRPVSPVPALERQQQHAQAPPLAQPQPALAQVQPATNDVSAAECIGSKRQLSFAISSLPPELQKLLRETAPSTPPGSVPPGPAAPPATGAAAAAPVSGRSGAQAVAARSSGGAADGSDGSPASSEGPGVPLKKRKMLVL